MKRYRCKLCNYIYEGDELPLNFVCPVCGVDYSNFEVYVENKIDKRVKISDNNPAIYRINEKCINCGQCKDICENKVGIKHDYDKSSEVICINCGQCVLGCPAGALVPKYNYKEVDEIIKSKKKVTIAITAPAVRVSLGEEFGLNSGTFVEGKMVSALKELGFDFVFDVTFGADMTIMEEVNELLNRFNNGGTLPMFTSCCPSWVKYAEIFHPEILPNLSTTKSPISIHSTLIKKYFAKLKNINEEDIVVVAITPCTAKKMEATREELKGTDYVLTTSELAIYIREKEIDFNTLNDKNFDELMSKGSGGGLIFGNSGGVMESAMRALNYFVTGEKIDDLKLETLKKLRGQENFKETTVEIGNKLFNVAVVYSMPALEEFLNNIKHSNKQYHFVEVMSCPGGCIGGGGQPLKAIAKLNEIRDERIKSLYKDEEKLNIRSCFENPDVKKVYSEYLGKPLSEKSEKLLHTKYYDKSNLLNKETVEVK